MFRKLMLIILVMALVVTACSFQITLPVTQKAGPTVVDEISIPLPTDTARPVDLTLKFGAGILKINPAGSGTVSGTATYNVSDFKPTVIAKGNTVSITQGNWRLTGIPDFSNILLAFSKTSGGVFSTSAEG